jgi:CUG-BP- and ETR3-like factor
MIACLQALQAVVRVPKLFVGHVPLNFKEKELTQLFSSHGNVVKVTLLKGPEGKPRGCAMVQFTTWSEAEAAQSALHGSPPAKGLNGKPLVVQFAQPRRGNNGMLLEGAIAPRKLYVTKVG